nr:hypothetical protein LVJ77_02885 [Conchiformibius kuhniae]
MKKPLFILTLAAAVSPVLDAKVYSCVYGCYSDKSKGSKGYANLGKQIGTYTAAKPKPALDNVAENQTAPVVPVQHAHGSRNRIARPVPVTVKRQAAPRPLPAVAVARPKANPAKSGGTAAPFWSRSLPTSAAPWLPHKRHWQTGAWCCRAKPMPDTKAVCASSKARYSTASKTFKPCSAN